LKKQRGLNRGERKERKENRNLISRSASYFSLTHFSLFSSSIPASSSTLKP